MCHTELICSQSVGTRLCNRLGYYTFTRGPLLDISADTLMSNYALTYICVDSTSESVFNCCLHVSKCDSLQAGSDTAHKKCEMTAFSQG